MTLFFNQKQNCVPRLPCESIGDLVRKLLPRAKIGKKETDLFPRNPYGGVRFIIVNLGAHAYPKNYTFAKVPRSLEQVIA